MTPSRAPIGLDLWQLKLRARPELRISHRDESDASAWLVEDPLRGKYFEIGDQERQLLAALDGNESLAAALEKVPAGVLAPAETLIIARWLIEQELVQVLDASGKPVQLTSAKTNQPRAPFNPLMCEIFTFNPASLLNTVRGGLRYLWSWSSAILWGALAVAAIIKLSQHLHDWISVPTQVLDPGNWLRMALVWAGLKLVHECGHALASERYGAPVTRAGLKLMLFAPVAFVDVTASWRLPQRTQRILIAAAGMIVELLVAFIAVLLWTPGSTRLVDRICVDIAVLAGGHTLLFNLNPLMRFDGYFMLADWLGITNLAAEGARRVTRLRRHWLGGVDLPPLDESLRRAAGLLVYGLLASIWRATMLLTMIVGLIASWDRWGVVASGVLAWFWLGGSAMLQQRRAGEGQPTRRARRRQVLATATVAIVLTAFVGWLASPARVESPAVVEYAPLTLLRADADGFVESVTVKAGETVERGQTVMLIRNDDLTRELQQLNSQRAQTAIQARLHLQQNELTQHQALLAKLTALDEQVTERHRQCDALTVKATSPGTIVTRDLMTLVGRYVRQGDVLVAIGDDEQKELIVSVAAEDEAEYVARQDQSVDAYRAMSLDRTAVGRLTQLEPRARYELPHEALGANSGGPIVVRSVARDSIHSEEISFKSLEPRLIAKVSLDRATSRSVRAGERVSVAFYAVEQSWARRWIDALSRYVRQLAHYESQVSR
ncbi:MAG: efflux RND transporter periplasmic adaptor subunit [Planctomycetaceae bacterium]|nr:efflux RND transporter periplasmic adaptor subunit [Planctomycetaceae bacterium]